MVKTIVWDAYVLAKEDTGNDSDILILTIEFNSTYGYVCLWQTCHVM
jgi:hypothetical protein